MLLLAAMSPGAMAEWVQVAESDKTVYYIDPATIRKNGNFRRYWSILDLKQPGKDGEMSMRALVEYDCKEERSRHLSATVHSKPMASGEILISSSSPLDWDYIAPGTIFKYVFEFLCAR